MRRSLLLAVALAALGGAPLASGAGGTAPAAKVRFELALQVPASAPLAGSLVLTPDVAGAAPVVLPVRGEAALPAQLPPATRWQVSLDVPGYWARSETLTVEPTSAEIVRKIVVWPLGTIAGRVRMAEPGERRPRELAVATVQPAVRGGQRSSPQQRLACPIDEQGVWRCNLPAATFDLALSAEGFIPHYRWGVEVPAGSAIVLGTLDLKRGASVAGWAAVEDGSLVPGRCFARLSSPVAPGLGGDPSTVNRVRSTAREVAVGKDGFFQLAGIAPGSYLLEVEQPEYAPAKAYPIEVWPGAETRIQQPLLLKRALQLEFAISPPLDWLGRPWRVEVFRVSDFSASRERAYSEAADPEGRVKIPGQAPGSFSISVLDSLDNRLFGEMSRRIDGPEDARQTIEIDLVTVRGSVGLGREPLPATLWFGGRFGVRRVKMEADHEGKFHGVLPKEGSWDVEIESADPKLNLRKRVRVVADRAGRASVEIALPDTHLFGRVVDEESRPVPRASVGVHTADADLYLEADETGAFETRGVEEGTADLLAERDSDDAMSDPLRVPLTEGQPTGPVELRVRRAKPFAGKVVSALGPVAGATVAAYALNPEPPGASSTRTGLAGEFEVRLPARAESVALVVSPPGHALQAFAVPFDTAPVTLQVSAEGGALEVSVPYSQDDLRDRGFYLNLFQNDLVLSIPSLADWARGHGQDFGPPDLSRFRVPALAPGVYRVCMIPRGFAGQEAPESTWSCATGTLGAGGTLSLAVPKPSTAS